MPIMIQTVLVCQNAEDGYSTGDEIMAFGIGGRNNPMPNAVIEAGGLNLYLMVGCENTWSVIKQAGQPHKSRMKIGEFYSEFTVENHNFLCYAGARRKRKKD